MIPFGVDFPFNPSQLVFFKVHFPFNFQSRMCLLLDGVCIDNQLSRHAPQAWATILPMSGSFSSLLNNQTWCCVSHPSPTTSEAMKGGLRSLWAMPTQVLTQRSYFNDSPVILLYLKTPPQSRCSILLVDEETEINLPIIPWG